MGTIEVKSIERERQSPFFTLLPNLSVISILPLRVAESRDHLRRNEKVGWGGAKPAEETPFSSLSAVTALFLPGILFLGIWRNIFNDSVRPACTLVSDCLAAVEGTTPNPPSTLVSLYCLKYFWRSAQVHIVAAFLRISGEFFYESLEVTQNRWWRWCNHWRGCCCQQLDWTKTLGCVRTNWTWNTCRDVYLQSRSSETSLRINAGVKAWTTTVRPFLWLYNPACSESRVGMCVIFWTSEALRDPEESLAALKRMRLHFRLREHLQQAGQTLLQVTQVQIFALSVMQVIHFFVVFFVVLKWLH